MNKPSSKYDELSRTKYCAFLILGRRAHTKKELTDKLLKKEYSPECVAETVLYMEEEGYINDRDYAERYLNDAVELKKHGMARIKQDLLRKGIDREIVEEVLENTEKDNTETIKKILEIRLPKVDLNDKKQRDRLIGYMLRRGFRYGEVYSALRDYMDEGDYYCD